MQENWQILLKQGIKNQYVQKSQEWVDVNISTSGLLNLTIVSDRFIGLSISQRQEQISNLLKSQVPLLQSLQNLNKSSINFVFSPVPDVSKLDKVKEIYQSLLDEIKISTDEESKIDDNDPLEIPEPLVIPCIWF
ncbi:MAG: hypothetical protein ACK4ZH_09190 [Dolichospermum sp.]|jgi:stress-induced morphogen